MTAPHFFAAEVGGGRVVLTGEEARHAVRSLRLRPGEPITVSDGRGTVASCRVVEAGATLVAEVEARRVEPRPRPSLVVLQAIPKAAKLDLVVAKLAELGAMEVRPFAAARSVPRWDAGRARAQRDRLAAVALAASKRSRRAWLLEVGEPAPLDRVRLPEPCLVLHEGASLRLGEALPAEPPAEVGLVVGPEGGLAPEEVASLEARGASVVVLGPLILGTETAALAAACVVLARYGLLG
jgi:16S rRNA (uracil1498-N3)-methyltransferase